MSLSFVKFDLSSLSAGYRAQHFTPDEVVREALARIARGPAGVWIRVLSEAEIAPYLAALAALTPENRPLYGLPFAIKDNIDLANIPTTAACPDFAYTPENSAFVVASLVAAGAIPLGKTNLDQFATGLVGTRSPYGVCPNAFDPAYISGGSSSGSAVALALGQVSFALGTDTAGSGRVPAALNHVVGMKPTRGLISTRGVVPACRSLDCVSIFANSVSDARQVLQVAHSVDPHDAFGRDSIHSQRKLPEQSPPTRASFGVPREDQLSFSNSGARELFEASVRRLEALGWRAQPIDFAPFYEAARLLYDGPWLAERYAALGEFLERAPDAVLPITRSILERGRNPSAVDSFRAAYRLRELHAVVQTILADLDFVLTPTTPGVPKVEEVAAAPLQVNTDLGTYTNFMNLLDLAALAVPAGILPERVPFGVTFFAGAGSDCRLLEVAAQFERRPVLERRMVVCGAHMRGLPLNIQLLERGGRFLFETQSSPNYRLYALPGPGVERPGMVRVAADVNGDQPAPGAAIALEVWALPEDRWGDFIAGIPRPLGIGSVELENGEWAQGFVCEAYATSGARDITELGGWRRYLRDKAAS